MSEWIAEPEPARRDARKSALLEALPSGSVVLPDGELLPGSWFRLEAGGELVGLGWMDVTWGDAQVVIAVHPEHQGAGHGATIVGHLAGEARKRGLAYLFNSIPADHPDASGVRAFLERNGFVASGLDSGLLRKRVR